MGIVAKTTFVDPARGIETIPYTIKQLCGEHDIYVSVGKEGGRNITLSTPGKQVEYEGIDDDDDVTKVITRVMFEVRASLEIALR
jgi:hypothetical protein